ncbi:MAG: hypothetical protein DDT26_02389 [Dehalococcoidia bacterium]|nr:hypothetical protein [Chloroflexota bacterium]
MVRRETGPWNAAALPEIMAGALQESKGGVLGAGQTEEQQASNRAALPGAEEVERLKVRPHCCLFLHDAGQLCKELGLQRKIVCYACPNQCW